MRRPSKKSKSSKLPNKLKSEGALLLSQMPEKELLRVIDRLRLAARRYYGPLDPDDLVNETLKRVLTGARGWKSDWPVFKNLYWNLRSIAYDELQKDGRLVSLEEAIVDNERMWVGQEMSTAGLSPTDMLEMDENERLTKTALHLRTKNDSLLNRILEILLDTGKWKPKEIATTLGVDPKLVYSQKRRLQRRFAMLRTLKQRVNI